MSKSDTIHATVTAEILHRLRQGVVPWQQTWASPSLLPRNLLTRKVYRGINFFILGSTGYESPYWLTQRQAESLGGKVVPGARAQTIVYWHWPDDSKAPASPPPSEEGSDSNGGEREPDRPAKVLHTIPVLRDYRVFNLSQCEELPSRHLPPSPQPLPIHIPNEAAEAIVSGMPDPPRITHGAAGPHYAPLADTVGMPDPCRFLEPRFYYDALFHELAHSTGHPRRLGRFKLDHPLANLFGSTPYCREELVAEMTATMLCAHVGISDRQLMDNSAAYIAGWLEQLRRDNRFVVFAAAQASKASDWIRGVSPTQ